MTLKKQIAELTEEVRRLREEVAALRLCPPVQFVPYVLYYPPVVPSPPNWWEYPTTPQFTITCNEGPTS